MPVLGAQTHARHLFESSIAGTDARLREHLLREVDPFEVRDSLNECLQARLIAEPVLHLTQIGPASFCVGTREQHLADSRSQNTKARGERIAPRKLDASEFL